ncbi:hypothetical protein HMPREF1586_01255 [Gardnerella vaginalis JCP8522]|nr:hypothetical protein HMPREF1586_01255 [Gardnerella vaginalis JCP8522]
MKAQCAFNASEDVSAANLRERHDTPKFGTIALHKVANHRSLLR